MAKKSFLLKGLALSLTASVTAFTPSTVFSACGVGRGQLPQCSMDRASSSKNNCVLGATSVSSLRAQAQDNVPRPHDWEEGSEAHHCLLTTLGSKNSSKAVNMPPAGKNKSRPPNHEDVETDESVNMLVKMKVCCVIVCAKSFVVCMPTCMQYEVRWRRCNTQSFVLFLTTTRTW